jgi:hypothetical protein
MNLLGQLMSGGSGGSGGGGGADSGGGSFAPESIPATEPAYVPASAPASLPQVPAPAYSPSPESASPASLAHPADDTANAALQVSRYFQLRNNTGEDLAVSIQFYGQDDQGNWQWFGESKPLKYTVKTGQKAYFGFNNDRIHGSMVCFWAESTSGKTWSKHKEKGFWLVPEVDQDDSHWYNGEDIQTRTYTLNP